MQFQNNQPVIQAGTVDVSSINRGGRTLFIHVTAQPDGTLKEVSNDHDPVVIPRDVHEALGSGSINGTEAVFVIGQRQRAQSTNVEVSADGASAAGINVGNSLREFNQRHGLCGTSVYASLHDPTE